MRYFLLSIMAFSWLCGRAQDSATEVQDTVIFVHGSFDDFQQRARFENKPYFIMFTASWCAPCHRIKSELFANQRIAALANENYLAYTIDLENFDQVELNSKLFQVSQLPAILFFDPLGKPTDKAVGFFDAHYFFRKLRAHIPPSRWGGDWRE